MYGSWGSEVNEGVCHKDDTPTKNGHIGVAKALLKYGAVYDRREG